MHNLKQANWDFSTYLAEFLHLTSDTEYDDNTKLTALREELSHELCALLLTILDKSDNFDDYVKLLQKLDSKQQVKKQRTKTYAACTSASTITVSTTCINSDNVNNTLSLINVTCSMLTASSTFIMTGTHSEPMNLSSGPLLSLVKKKKTVETVKSYVNTVKVLNTLQESISILVSQGQCMWLSSTHLSALIKSQKTHSLWDKLLSET